MIGLDKATEVMMNIASDEKPQEKKEVFEKAAAAMTTLLSLEGDIKEHIRNVTCKDKECQKWYQLGEEHIATVVNLAVSSIDF